MTFFFLLWILERITLVVLPVFLGFNFPGKKKQEEEEENSTKQLESNKL